MTTQRSLSGARAITLVGLVAGAVGNAILRAAGVEFPVYPPPGIVILLVGALLVGLAPWRWAPVVGALLGLFVAAETRHWRRYVGRARSTASRTSGSWTARIP